MTKKSQEEKEFLISTRKSMGPGLTNAPAWIMQKAGKRIWNKKAQRHWRDTNLMIEYRKKQAEQGKVKDKKPVKKGKHKKSASLRRAKQKK
ncbi:MAG: hypothetical protein NUV67_03175 [archaeon]|nr:hypothetical protein [archaeon]